MIFKVVNLPLHLQDDQVFMHIVILNSHFVHCKYKYFVFPKPNRQLTKAIKVDLIVKHKQVQKGIIIKNLITLNFNYMSYSSCLLIILQHWFVLSFRDIELPLLNRIINFHIMKRNSIANNFPTIEEA